MVAYVSDEVYIFLWSIVTGIVIMLGYDFLCAATSRQKYSIVVCNIVDGVFVTCASALMIFVLLAVSNGYVRSYEFIGAFIGGFLYKISLGIFAKKVFIKITDVIYAVFEFFFKILLTPLNFMYKIICNILSVLCGFVRRLMLPAVRCGSRFVTLFKTTLKKT
jgi:hypothetical protein